MDYACTKESSFCSINTWRKEVCSWFCMMMYKLCNSIEEKDLMDDEDIVNRACGFMDAEEEYDKERERKKMETTKVFNFKFYNFVIFNFVPI